MSQENVEIVKAAYDAYNRGDVDAALKDAAPDFELDWSRATGPQRGIFRLDQVRPFFYDFLEAFESTRIAAENFIEADQHVVVPQTGHLQGRGGVEVTARITMVWTIRDGSIVRACLYQGLPEALEAVGLSEGLKTPCKPPVRIPGPIGPARLPPIVESLGVAARSEFLGV